MLQVSTGSLDRLLTSADQALVAGRHEEAETLTRQVLSLQPRHARAFHRLGLSIALRKRHAEAIEPLRRAVAIDPGFADAWHDLAFAYIALERAAEARTAFEAALAAAPGHVRARRALAALLAKAALFDAADVHYQQLVKLDPQNGDVWFEYGRALSTGGKAAEAIRAYEQALVLMPQHADAQHELGIALQMARRSDEARVAFERAIALNPRHIGAHNNLGNLNKNTGRLSDAAASFERALACDPNVPATRNNLGALYIMMGRCEEALEQYRRAVALDPSFTIVRAGYIYCRQFVPGIDRRALFEESRQLELSLGGGGAVPAFDHSKNDRSPDRRLRVGYVSADFRRHSVAYFMENILACHDRKQVEVFCYSHLPTPDATTERLKGLADRWVVTTGFNEAQLAQRIYNDAIDIVVDLAGHTSGSRLGTYAMKPAPVQVTYLGYPDTTGLSAMDYRLTDAYADPTPASGLRTDPPDCYYSEKLIRLPETFLCYRPPEEAPETAEREGGQEGGQGGEPLTFVSFNALAKISSVSVELWSRILRELPESRMLIKSLGLQDEAVHDHLLKRFVEQGIEAHRLKIVGQTLGVREHLALYQTADIGLDTFPYHGTTTTCEALWMGVPVVTLAGETHASRVGVSILNNVGLAHLVTQTPDTFVAAAVALARDASALRELHGSLRERMERSPLLDGPRFARNVERAYRDMWRNWCRS